MRRRQFNELKDVFLPCPYLRIIIMLFTLTLDIKLMDKTGNIKSIY